MAISLSLLPSSPLLSSVPPANSPHPLLFPYPSPPPEINPDAIFSSKLSQQHHRQDEQAFFSPLLATTVRRCLPLLPPLASRPPPFLSLIHTLTPFKSSLPRNPPCLALLVSSSYLSLSTHPPMGSLSRRSLARRWLIVCNHVSIGRVHPIAPVLPPSFLPPLFLVFPSSSKHVDSGRAF